MGNKKHHIKKDNNQHPTFHYSVLKFILHFIKPKIWQFLFLPISSIIQYHSVILYSLLFQNALKGISLNSSIAQNSDVIFPYFAKYLIAPALLSLSFGTYCLLTSSLVPWFIERMRAYFFNFILGNSYFYFLQTPTGSINSRINSMTSSSVKIIQYFYSDLIPTISLMVTTLIILFGYHYSLRNIISLWIIFHIIIYFIRLPNYMQLSIKNALLFANLNGVIIDILNNILAIRIFNSTRIEDIFFEKAQKSDIDSYKKVLRYEKISLVMMDVLAYVPILTILLIYTLLKLHLDGIISIGEAMVAFNAARSMSAQLWKATAMLGDILIDVSRCKDALQMLTLPHRVVDDFPDNPLKTKGYDGSVEFTDLSFVYSSLKSEENSLLFENFNLKIPGKTKVALVGSSGSGKSTVISLLTRINEPIKGSIKINEQDIKTVSRESIANTISLITQNPLLFQRSIFENIGYGFIDFREFFLSQDPKEKLQFYKIPQNLQFLIIESAKKAEAHEFIIDLPNGYDSIYGAEVNLSGGQKQRLMIARAFMNKEAQLMVLDEATSALDSETDVTIKRALEKMDITIIMVAHKLNMVKNFDRIIVFEEGKIIEDGEHEQLLTQGGKYYSLWEAQLAV